MPANIKNDVNVTDTRWHHYAITYDGSTIRGYLDGVEVSIFKG